MAAFTKKWKIKKETLIIIIVCIIIAVSLYLLLAPKFGWPMSWQELFDRLNPSKPKATYSQNAAAEVHFIDVGQGDSALLISGDKAALIDCGERGSGDAISKVLDENGVKKLDFILFSHSDSDHIGGADEVMEKYPTDTIYADRIPKPTNSQFDEVVSIAKKSGTKIVAPKDSQFITLGDITLTVYLPRIDNDDENENCIIVMADVIGTDILFTGDIGTSTESALIEQGYDIDCDILKVGHHGSKGSTSKRFASATSPEQSVISVGDNNYGHPSEKVIDYLEKVKSKILRTDKLGTVSYNFSPNQYSLAS